MLGGKLLGWKTIGYVEIDDYCQRLIAQRIKDGVFDEAPIFTDIRAFIDQGYAEAYQGMVDVVSAGFPCQPFSCAGQRKGAADERNMWPETIECIRIIRPRFAFLENVPGLLAHGYIYTIFRDLAEGGYDARWRVLSAAEVGAPHKRDRLWIVADAGCVHDGPVQQKSVSGGCKKADSCKSGADVADAERKRKLQSKRRERQERGRVGDGGWWDSEPDVGRVANGVPGRVHRLKALGNSIVPQIAEEIGRAIWKVTKNQN